MHKFHPKRRFLLPQDTDAVLARNERRRPSTLFLTCSDSILDTSLIPALQTAELLLVRRPGNKLTGATDAEVGFTDLLERMVSEAGVANVVVCGHSHCSAMRPAAPANASDAPRSWYERTQQRIAEAASRTTRAQENVMIQLYTLLQLSGVAAATASGRLRLHGAFYLCESGALLFHDDDAGEFVPPTKEFLDRQWNHANPVFRG